MNPLDLIPRPTRGAMRLLAPLALLACTKGVFDTKAGFVGGVVGGEMAGMGGQGPLGGAGGFDPEDPDGGRDEGGAAGVAATGGASGMRTGGTGGRATGGTGGTAAGGTGGTRTGGTGGVGTGGAGTGGAGTGGAGTGGAGTGGAGGVGTGGATGAVIFSDEFSGAALDTTKWVALDRHGDYGNNEAQCYLPANAAVVNGQLVLTAKLETRTCGDSGHAASSWKYTSAMVQPRTFSFTYGTIEFRVKAPGGAGPWPAVWLLGANCQQPNVMSADNSGTCHWPQAGSDEIDMFEILGSNHRIVNQQIHAGSNNGGCQPAVADVSADFHTYQVVWAPGSLIWKVDGKQTCEVKSGVPSTPMFLLMNIAMGGNAGGPVNDSTLPQTMQIDYLRITR